MPHQIMPRFFKATPWLALVFLAACATAPEPQPDIPALVYPAPPDPARFIYERTLRYSSNVEVPEKISRLRQFATGETEQIKGLVKPYGVAAHQGRVYVTDTVQRKLIMFDIDGQRYGEFGMAPPGELFKPIGIAISEQGEIFVADVSAQRITVFDLDGQFQRFIGSSSQLKRPAGVAVSPDSQRVYVIDTGGVDTQAHHLHIFNAQSGEHLKTIGSRGKAPGQFNLPLQVTTAPNGHVYVVDKGNFRVQEFSADGDYLSAFGSAGRMPGQFFSPKGIATDNDGNIYVVDTAFGNVQIFNPAGQLLMVMGQRGQSSAPGNYMLPAGIDVGQDGRVYISDQFFRKIDIYRPVNLGPDPKANHAAK